MKYFFGPVLSRRLGRSLGVNIIPAKTCNFNCIYCQLGKTNRFSGGIKKYIDTEEFLAQLKSMLKKNKNIDSITFSGAGEPTLNSQIGVLIWQVKKITSTPVAVITNSSLLYKKYVQDALMAADIVVPSLDAVDAKIFKRINRPCRHSRVKKIINGLIKFSRRYKGKLWLEILLVKGVNDSAGHLKKMAKTAKLIKSDKIQLNTVLRPPAENFACPLSQKELKSINAKFFGGLAEVVSTKKLPRREILKHLMKKVKNA